jgi:hypothetical protein
MIGPCGDISLILTSHYPGWGCGNNLHPILDLLDLGWVYGWGNNLHPILDLVDSGREAHIPSLGGFVL